MNNITNVSRSPFFPFFCLAIVFVRRPCLFLFWWQLFSAPLWLFFRCWLLVVPPRLWARFVIVVSRVEVIVSAGGSRNTTSDEKALSRTSLSWKIK